MISTTLLSCLALVVLLINFPAHATTPITDAFVDLNRIHKWDESNGDTWDPFWADDDNLYAFNCDGRGFGTKMRNFALNKLVGDSVDTLAGTMINTMDEYGASQQKGPDSATWKALGQECIDSVFYAFVSRHVYGSQSKDPLLRQTAANASLIKSTDRGVTWSRTAAENYDHPMWPGRRFGAPYFFHYGKNGGNVAHDSADQYVYAISNNGFWNDGDDVILGRVERTKIAKLNASDWEYFKGGDGAKNANWCPQIQQSAPIMSLPGKCGTTSPCYVPSLNMYLIVVWYNPEKLNGWFNPPRMNFDFYQADHAWGPWALISSCDDKFIVGGGHWYGPTLCAKFQHQSGTETEISLFISGCQFEDKPTGLYKAWEIPIVLKTTPLTSSTLINDDDPRIQYTGHWSDSSGRKYSDYHDDVHYTKTAGDSLEFIFTGIGIDYIAEKYKDQGIIEIDIDGQIAQSVNLKTNNFPRLSQITVFRSGALRNGNHRIKIVNKSDDFAVVDAFKVYGY